ncbi:uncharacterized protein LOC120048849 [Salvelinus namaycush]|uniref:Uncharacterized protein LOC120048849 n=1 Tax=Salvelinus namaycush TaxID=8040 RepID=A0A8U0QWW9_SALNM|nr:uncharacterized protein LOC120048849 [Salvelinus namaycush]XP_038851076.1 uncharacterized protein LOC120048849 [Salvelinus namaycush]
MANDICSVNDSKITELKQTSAGGKVVDPYPNCKKIGVDFHVGSGAKQKLDIGLLTNGVMTEVSHFAEEMNRSHAHVICDILDYNIDLGLQNDQRHEFAIRTMAKVKYLMGKSRLQRPDLITKVFELPDPRAIPVSKTHVNSNLLNDNVSFSLRLNKDVEIQQLVIEEEEECVSIMSFEEDGLVEYEKAQKDNTVSLMNFDLDASQVSPHHVKETMFNETDVETATLALKNGPTNICIKDEPNLDLVSTQHVKIETISTDTDVSLSDEEAVHRPTRDQSFMTSATEDKTTDLYPLCKKIGLDLDVKSKGEGKEKLDFRLLTRGVMLEVAKFAADVCGTYRQIVSAALEYNFDLDFSQKIDLLENIIHNLRSVKKKMKS